MKRHGTYTTAVQNEVDSANFYKLHFNPES